MFSKFSSPTSTMSTISVFLLLLLLTSIPMSSSLTFNFSTFTKTQVTTSCTQGSATICLQGDAILNENNTIDLTIFDYHKAGRAYYSEPVPLWSPTTGRRANFTTQFEFWINKYKPTIPVGDGFTFFLVPYPSNLFSESKDNNLGLYNPNGPNQLVAVEFDTYNNTLNDPEPVGNFTEHVGIDVNSVTSMTTVPWESGIKMGRKWNANVEYNSATGNLTVLLKAIERGVVNGRYNLSHNVNLSKYLPNQVAVGFSGSTGGGVEIHRITAWNFTSDLMAEEVKEMGKSDAKYIKGDFIISMKLFVLVFYYLFWF